MRVAWVTHRDVQSRSGGAEASDDDMISKRPEGTEVMLVEPGGVAPDLEEFDKVVVTGVYRFTENEVAILARCNPVVWAHDHQFSGHWLYTQARAFIALTPQHLEQELDNNSRLEKSRCFVNPGWFDTSKCQPKEKDPFALWAHRPEWHKGLHRAYQWAEENFVTLEVMIGKPHDEVLMKMSHATYFILLSEIFDAGPRAVTEAKLSGCDLILDNVGGHFDLQPDDLRELIDTAADRFWEVVMS